MESRERVLITSLVHMADTLVADYDPVELAQELVDVLVRLLPVQAAGVMLADHLDRLEVLATTSEATRLLELFQIQAAAGPCVEAYHSGQRVLVPELGAEHARWPAFCDRARADGWSSVYALPMRLRENRIGAINLFATGSDERPDENDLAVARALADVATIGIVHARMLADSVTVSAQLQGALNSRVIIEQAKGVLSEHGGVDMDEAFAVLRAYARATNIRLLDLARAIIERTADVTAVLAHPTGGKPDRGDPSARA
ncbi:GAF and ANTAR domain-containing protein [Nocardia sp. NPDC048505]|uniref:GAF and ANTAR domain-containing protein n=1 Tax=unclassified Nocardia TaxID=2637762 RepID=UPI00340036CD